MTVRVRPGTQDKGLQVKYLQAFLFTFSNHHFKLNLTQFLLNYR